MSTALRVPESGGAEAGVLDDPAGAPAASDDNATERPRGPLLKANLRAPLSLIALTLAGMLLLLVLFALYFTGPLFVPLIFSIGLYLVLQPVMRGAARLRVPKLLAAPIIILALFGGVGALGYTLADPAAEWVAKAPESLRRLETRLFFVKRPIADLQNVGEQVEKMAEMQAVGAPAVKVAGPGMSSLLFSGTTATLLGFGTTIILLFFLLISGDLFLRRFVEILPTFSDKKRAVEISREIESNISTYLATITLMNVLVGALTGAVAYFCGLSDPILWATLIFALNFIPILGPLAGMVVLSLAGLLTFDPLYQALLPAAIYVVIHFVEGQIVTPMLLARRFTLNPVVVILSVIFWCWMWGVPGALLAVPLVATIKIICDRIEPLMAVGHFLGGETRA